MPIIQTRLTFCFKTWRKVIRLLEDSGALQDELPIVVDTMGMVGRLRCPVFGMRSLHCVITKPPLYSQSLAVRRRCHRVPVRRFEARGSGSTVHQRGISRGTWTSAHS
ncbi:unnamed protein product, partial [Ixodes pacificus]